MVSCRKYSKEWKPYVPFLISSPVVISYVTLCNIIFKTEGGSFKFMDTMNIDFVYSEPLEEKKLYIKSSNNDSLK